MRFFTYGRKSVFKDSSDSIDNQFRMCREYCEMRFPGEIDSWTQFSDEDFTGANTNRPDFQLMMSQIRNDMCDVLVVYQLDRFSRDVKDFSVAYAELQAHRVRFICLDINIDTSTPIGEAMMYVSAAFGQMERKNIALRVADNMTGLAKKGYWVGGNPPIGYVRSRITIDGRKHVTIVADSAGVEYMHWLYDYFLSKNYSLQSLETEFRKQGIKSQRGGFFSTTQLHQLLTSPYCCEATQEVYDYYEKKGCQMASPRELWDGSCGVMVYGRSTCSGKKHSKQPPSEWVVCLGVHKPFMPADKWLSVQSRLQRNTFFKKKKYDVPLLRGVLRCSCGALMAVSSKKRTSGSVGRWYYCERRMRKGAEACSCSQIKTDLLDEKALKVFTEIQADPNMIKKYIETAGTDNGPDPRKINTKIATAEDKIGRLAASLALAENSSVSRYIIAEMESVDADLRSLKQQRIEAESMQKAFTNREKDAVRKAKDIANLINGLDGFTAEERNEIVRSVVRECTWDGESLFILF